MRYVMRIAKSSESSNF